jgi:glycosyltransferase involved in cell wall biosynthesis
MNSLLPQIYILSNSSRHISLGSVDCNPGIGGTEFTEIILAILLASYSSHYQVVFSCKAGLELSPNIPSTNLRVETRDQIDILGLLAACSNDSKAQDFVIIASQGLLEKLPLRLVNALSDRIICIIHHPYSYSRQIKGYRFPYCVAVGAAQYYTLAKYHRNLVYIQNLTAYSLSSVPKCYDMHVSRASPRFLFLGALFKEKGFHLIAKEWKKIRSIFPNSVMDVIGGSQTYGSPASHPFLPTSYDYGEMIMDALGQDTSGITFHGNLGEEKLDLLSKTDLALLNPTGLSEAFPATPLECMAFGIPVIASSHQGMRDTMQYFPELSIKCPTEISGKVTEILSNHLFYRCLSLRALRVARSYHESNHEALARWDLVLSSLLDPSCYLSKNHLVPPLPTPVSAGNTRSMRMRILTKLKTYMSLPMKSIFHSNPF